MRLLLPHPLGISGAGRVTRQFSVYNVSLLHRSSAHSKAFKDQRGSLNAIEVTSKTAATKKPSFSEHWTMPIKGVFPIIEAVVNKRKWDLSCACHTQRFTRTNIMSDEKKLKRSCVNKNHPILKGRRGEFPSLHGLLTWKGEYKTGALSYSPPPSFFGCSFFSYAWNVKPLLRKWGREKAR